MTDDVLPMPLPDKDAEPPMADPAPPLNVWDRQYGESPQAFDAFLTYMDAGPTRSLQRTASKCGKSRHLLERWSTQFYWRKRAYRWDCEQDRIRLLNHRKELDKMSDRHAKLARAMSSKLIDRLQSLDVQELTARDVATWIKTIVEIERHALGERTLVRPRRGRPFADDDTDLRFENGQFKPKAKSKVSSASQELEAKNSTH